MKNKIFLWLAPILFMAVIAPFTPFLDLTVSRYFYNFPSSPFYDFIYNYGILPVWFVVIPAIISYAFYKTWRPHALFLILTLAIGSGVITHAILKDHWGRPRPKQVIEFGGKQEFRPFYKPNPFHQPEKSASFPCGHCSVGFFFFTFVILGWRLRKRWLVYSGWILSIGLGTLLGLTRIAQGGHFLSDVLMSALIMWLSALLCDWLVYKEPL